MRKTKLAAIIGLSVCMFASGCARHGSTGVAATDSITDIASSAQVDAETETETETEAIRECHPYYSNPDDWYDADGNMVMPISLDEEKWQSSPIFEDRCNLCTIPQTIIDKASTEELAKMVIECNMNYLIDLYGDVDEGMNTVYKNFNGIRELLKRNDCGTVVLKLYSEYTIPQKKHFDYSLIDESLSIEESNKQFQEIFSNEEYCRQINEDALVGYNLHVPEWILTRPEVMEQFSEAERESVEDTVKRKYDELNKTEFKDEGNFFMDAMEKEKNQ